MRYIHEILCVQGPTTYAVTYTCIHQCTHEIIDAAIKPTISQPCVRSADDPRWHTDAPPRLRFCSLRGAAARRSASARYCCRQSVCVRITPSFLAGSFALTCRAVIMQRTVAARKGIKKCRGHGTALKKTTLS